MIFEIMYERFEFICKFALVDHGFCSAVQTEVNSKFIIYE